MPHRAASCVVRCTCAGYSGISLGWGWGGVSPLHVGGNVVANNSIAGFCGVLNDCGAIYTLGAQPGSRVTGNWIRDAAWRFAWPRSNNQAIYHDQGSAWFEDKGNVISNVDCWLSMCGYDPAGCGIHDVHVTGNFADVGNSAICCCHGANVSFAPNTRITGGAWPEAARRTMAVAGLLPSDTSAAEQGASR